MNLGRPVSAWWILLVAILAVVLVYVGLHNLARHDANARTRIEHTTP